jgi:hypothetical protein
MAKAEKKTEKKLVKPADDEEEEGDAPSTASSQETLSTSYSNRRSALRIGNSLGPTWTLVDLAVSYKGSISGTSPRYRVNDRMFVPSCSFDKERFSIWRVNQV